jgi:hypothetical protein
MVRTTGKVHRVEIRKQKTGHWEWVPTDAQGRVRLGGGRNDYSRRSSAIRGAKRACGPHVKIVVAVG